MSVAMPVLAETVVSRQYEGTVEPGSHQEPHAVPSYGSGSRRSHMPSGCRIAPAINEGSFQGKLATRAVNG
jgi:hypothetical protein